MTKLITDKELAELVVYYIDKGYNYENILDGETEFYGNDEAKDRLYEIYDECLMDDRLVFNKKYINKEKETK